MITQKGFSIILVILAVLLVLAGGIYFFQNEINRTEKQPQTLGNNDILNLDIPPIITQNKVSDTELRLTHSVPYRHTDLCDMRDGSRINEYFVDYSNIIYLTEGNFAQIIGQFFPSALLTDFVDTAGNLKLQAGFIDKIEVDSKEIYKITTGVEGCGYYIYIIPYGNKAVVIKKDFITPFFGNFTAETVVEFKNIEGVIKPEEAEVIFNDILSQIIKKLSVSEEEMMEITLFIQDKNMAQMSDCGATYKTTRQIPKTTGVLNASLEILFQEELAQYGEYDSVKIEAGIAQVRLKNSLTAKGVPISSLSSCEVGRLLSVLEDTLTQYPGVSAVELFSPEGKVVF